MQHTEAEKSLDLAWVTSVDMGLGHKRAAYPLGFLAREKVLVVGSDAETDPDERALWTKIRHMYEQVSRLKNIPLIGNLLFGIMDSFLRIPPLYPFRDYSSPSIQVKLVKRYIGKGLCRSMLRKINANPLPLVSTFYAPAIAADAAGYGRVYCMITDTDLNRAWVAANPRESRIEYFVPCGNAVKRLLQYGIPNDRIHLTGFPLPLQLLGNKDLDVLRRDLGRRLFRLDPKNRFWPLHEHNVRHFLGDEACVPPQDLTPTLAFAVGGAGAQKEIGYAGLKSLRQLINDGKLKMNFICGVRPEIREYFAHAIKELGVREDRVKLVYGTNDTEYFDNFTECLHETDILWTKPSELSFYVGLGIPLIIAPPIGDQEVKNRRWLMEVQAGIDQHSPESVDQWLTDLLDQGRLGDLAWDGFLKARKYGTYKILEILETGVMVRETSPLRR